jgi:hypothetical protein
VAKLGRAGASFIGFLLGFRRGAVGYEPAAMRMLPPAKAVIMLGRLLRGVAGV